MCSTRNTGLAASIGADTVIDYYNVILDNVANHRLPHCLRALTRKGTLVPNANTPGRWFGGLGRIIKAQVMAPFMPQRIRTCHGLVNQPDLVTLTGFIESGKITLVIDRTYPLTEVPEAIRYLEQGHARSKIVITM